MEKKNGELTFRQLVAKETDRLKSYYGEEFWNVPVGLITDWLTDNATAWDDELDYDECSLLEYLRGCGVYRSDDDDFFPVTDSEFAGLARRLLGF